MLFRLVFTLPALALLVAAQNCGPSYGNTICDAGKCCSQYGWCDTDVAHCDPATCLKQYSGAGSSCAAGSSSSVSTTAKTTSKTTLKTTTTTKKTSTKTTSSTQYASTVPNIDVCGASSDNISCPGAGVNGYFYRCCSNAGHCGPKNDIQDQSLYCGDGCQSGYGKCNSMSAPPEPTATPGVAQMGDTCGPIVNMKCDIGLCCSGSNYCGTGTDFCGSANWCQKDYGMCS